MARFVSHATNEFRITILLYAGRMAIYNNISKLIDIVIIYKQHVRYLHRCIVYTEYSYLELVNRE